MNVEFGSAKEWSGIGTGLRGVVMILAGPCGACLVGMLNDMLFLHNRDNNSYSVPEHVFESP